MSESDETIIIQYEKLCRTCTNESDEMTSLFKTDFSDNIPIVDILETCALIQVREDDGLPSHICLECYAKIKQIYDFRIQCQKSDELIRSYLNSTETQNMKIVKLENLVDGCNADFITQEVLQTEYTQLNDVEAIEELAIKMESQYQIANTVKKAKKDVLDAEYDQLNDVGSMEELAMKMESQYRLATAVKDYDEQYESTEEIETSTELCPETDLLSCPKCAKKFEKEDLYNAHIRYCEIHECLQCKKKFRSSGYLIKHMKKHDPDYVAEEKRFKCSECDKAYTSPANLRIHQYSHSGIKPYKCQYCGRGFTKTVSLNSHLALHTGKRSHVCSVCKRGFTSASILNQHKKIHSGERPFKCRQCNRSFTASGDLTIHMRSHTGEKPYLCPTCGQMFARITHLNTHIRTHTGERPYVCRQCGRGFAQSGDLRSHERTHTGERPYVCNICNKKFVQNSGLSSHMASHSSVKAHVCSICNRAFSQSSSLARHVKAHAQ